MSDLRSKLIRLAHANPSLRADLLPLLKGAAPRPKKNPDTDPHGIIGMEVPAADGGNYGLRILGYDADREDYLIQTIRWDTGKEISGGDDIDVNKITYRYDLKKARPSKR